MNDIDALTLKLLTSKKKYNTYLETVEPDNGSKIREYCNAVKTNKDRIKVLLAKYLDDPETQITNELDDSVESCLKELLRHLEARDRESKSARNDYDEQDEEEEEESFEEREESEERESCEGIKANKAQQQSYWGNNVKRSTAGTLDEFVKSNKKA
jgi:hypothetical protein